MLCLVLDLAHAELVLLSLLLCIIHIYCGYIYSMSLMLPGSVTQAGPAFKHANVKGLETSDEGVSLDWVGRVCLRMMLLGNIRDMV